MDAGKRFSELLEYEGRETKRWKEWLRRIQSAGAALRHSLGGHGARIAGPHVRHGAALYARGAGFAGAGLGEVARAGAGSAF
jgi:hypothetical protein